MLFFSMFSPIEKIKMQAWPNIFHKVIKAPRIILQDPAVVTLRMYDRNRKDIQFLIKCQDPYGPTLNNYVVKHSSAVCSSGFDSSCNKNATSAFLKLPDNSICAFSPPLSRVAGLGPKMQTLTGRITKSESFIKAGEKSTEYKSPQAKETRI